MTAPLSPTKKFFLNKKFFLYIKRSGNANVEKSSELIKLFGGQIEQFLDHEINYVLTDVPKSEWPPNGHDTILERARNNKVKLMSLNDLKVWCSKYITSHSSSSDDDEAKVNIKTLVPPFIKFEDLNGRFAPSVKEFGMWPEVNIKANLPLGKSFFNDPTILGTPNQSATNVNHPNNSAQLTQQALSLRTPNITSMCFCTIPPGLSNNANHVLSTAAQNHTPATSVVKNSILPTNTPINAGVKRRHSVYCEICNMKLAERIDDHIQTSTHLANIEKVNWSELNTVIESLPSLSTLNMRRLTNIPPPNGVEHQEFLCLHKVHVRPFGIS